MNDNKGLDFSSILPYLGTVIIFLGVTRLIFYYQGFGVSITNYLEFSEIITSFLDIIVIILLIFITTVLLMAVVKSKAEIERDNLLIEKIVSEQNFIERLKYYIRYIVPKLPFLFGFLTVCFFKDLFSKEKNFNNLIYLPLAYFITILLLIIINEVFVKHKQLNFPLFINQFYSLMFFSILFISITLLQSYFQIEDVKQNKKTYGTTITLDDNRVLFSDSSNYFIGKTQNFIFYYHEKTNAVDIIPVSKLKQLTLCTK